MISVKCPACGLVDWHGDKCKRCESPLPEYEAPPAGFNYYPASDDGGAAGGGRAARVVLALLGVTALALSTLGVLYLANKPAKKQWFWSFYRSEPTVAEIFAHNLEVSGGAKKIAGMRSFRATGRIAFRGGEAGRMTALVPGGVTFVMHAKEPDKVETEIEIGGARAATRFSAPNPFAPASPEVGVTLRRGFNGTRGWEYIERTVLTPGSTVPIKQHSTRELEGAELEQMKHSAKTAGLVRLADEYTSLALTGREAVAGWSRGESAEPGHYAALPTHEGFVAMGAEAYVVRGLNKEGKNETFYFDTDSGLLLRLDFEAEGPEGSTVNVECYFGEYREVEGLKFPHRLNFRRGEEQMTLSFEKYFPNDPIPDSTFDAPE